MKLCIVTHNVIKGDGQGRVNLEVAQEAIRYGHHVTLLASSVAPELQQSSQVNWISIPVKGWPTEFLRDLIFSWRSAAWLRKHHCEFDLVKVNGAITKAQGDVNAVHFVHSAWLRFSSKNDMRLAGNGLQPRRDLYSIYQWLYTLLNAHREKKAFHQAKVLVSVSEKIKQELVDVGVPEAHIRVISNGVDLEEFSPGYADRSQWSLPAKVTLALFAGDIRIPRKNLDTVLHALVEVPGLHLAVAGITEGSPYLQLAASLELSERVHFLGERYDIPEIMKAVDFLVFPSRYEPFGLVVIEAMASGLPVITTATTGAADLVTPACGIILANSEDKSALVQALTTLKNNPESRSQMGQAARAIAEQHSWNKMAQSYVDLFEELSKRFKSDTKTSS